MGRDPVEKGRCINAANPSSIERQHPKWGAGQGGRMFASQPERIGTAEGRIEESSRSGWIGGVVASLCLVWLALTGVLVYLSSAWAEPTLEIYIGGGLLAVLFFLKRFDSEQRLPHLLFLAISSVIVLRYLFWRVLYTIEFNDWLSFACAVILFAAELYGIIVFFIGCFINASPVTRSPPPLPPLNELPTVDVLVPSYNESPAILEATLLAALQMRYPEEKRKVYLCDDGGTDQKCSTGTPEAQAAARERRQELTELCAKLGAYYLTRPKPKVLVSGHLRRGVVRRFPGDGRDRRACACFSKILPRFRSWPARIKENLCNFWNR